MEPICTNPDCMNKIVTKNTDEDPPKITTTITDETIESILSENIESFHIHQYGSTVIFLEYLEGLEPSDEVINEYGKQGHVFLLPMRAIDLVDLKDKSLKHLTYKASDSTRVWYKIVIMPTSRSVGTKIKNLFH